MNRRIESAIVPCPSCHRRGPTEVRMFFGPRDGRSFKVGDKLSWTEDQPPDRGGRPPGGFFDGRGHATCSHCGRPLLVIIHVVSDILVAVEPTSDKKPNLDDY